MKKWVRSEKMTDGGGAATCYEDCGLLLCRSTVAGGITGKRKPRFDSSEVKRLGSNRLPPPHRPHFLLSCWSGILIEMSGENLEKAGELERSIGRHPG